MRPTSTLGLLAQGHYSVGVVVVGSVVLLSVVFSSLAQPTIPTRMAARAARSANFFIVDLVPPEVVRVSADCSTPKHFISKTVKRLQRHRPSGHLKILRLA